MTFTKIDKRQTHLLTWVNMGSPATKKTILVVDDEAELCEIMKYDLEDCGYDVFTATRVAEAIALYQTHPVDLVISDISMPGGDGTELLQVVRNHGEDHPPFLFLSGYAELSVAEAYQAGVHGFLQKPLSTEHLHEAVASALRDPSDRWATEKQPAPSIHLSQVFRSLFEAEQANIFARGHGGFSIIWPSEGPWVGAHASFSLSFAEDNLHLEGQAVCRWRRGNLEDTRMRLGLEITYLTDASKRLFRAWRQQLPSTAFIPL